MDEALVDIILILLAGLVAVSTVPQFDVEPPVSVEVTDGAQELIPIQVAIAEDGTLSTGLPLRTVGLQELYDQIIESEPGRTVELTASRDVSARYVIRVNTLISEAGRQAVFIVKAE